MRKRMLLVALAIIGLGMIATGLSTLYRYRGYSGELPVVTFTESRGFPMGWYGYSQIVEMMPTLHPQVYWYSVGSLLLDAVFWIAISSIGYVAIVKSISMVHKKGATNNLSVINV